MAASQTKITMNTQSNNASIGIKNSSSNSLHSLKNNWVLWAHLPHDSDWSINSYKIVAKFASAEDVIAVTEKLPETLIKNCMLFVMREGITPMWEDVKNRNGGSFSYKVSNKCIVDVWRDLTFVLVGESISSSQPFANSVTGITISPKKNFCIIKIWLTSCENQNPVLVTSDVSGLSSQGCLFNKHNKHADFKI
jgi:hypothetical protein